VAATMTFPTTSGDGQDLPVVLRPLHRWAGARVAVGRAGGPHGRPDRSTRRSGGHHLPVALQDGGRGAAGGPTGPPRAAPQGATRAGTALPPSGSGTSKAAPSCAWRCTIGRPEALLDACSTPLVGDEMATTVRGDLVRLKALAEEQAGTGRDRRGQAVTSSNGAGMGHGGPMWSQARWRGRQPGRTLAAVQWPDLRQRFRRPRSTTDHRFGSDGLPVQGHLACACPHGAVSDRGWTLGQSAAVVVIVGRPVGAARCLGHDRGRPVGGW
jgi:hypothetical protein